MLIFIRVSKILPPSAWIQVFTIKLCFKKTPFCWPLKILFCNILDTYNKSRWGKVVRQLNFSYPCEVFLVEFTFQWLVCIMNAFTLQKPCHYNWVWRGKARDLMLSCCSCRRWLSTPSPHGTVVSVCASRYAVCVLVSSGFFKVVSCLGDPVTFTSFKYYCVK